MGNPTALDLIEAAYSLIGIWDTTSPLTPYETQLGLTTLNDLMDQWDNENLLVFSTTPFTFPFQNNIQTYQVGSVNPFVCNILGDVMTVVSGTPGTVQIGNVLIANGVPANTTITGILTGNQYTLSWTAPLPITGVNGSLCGFVTPQTNTFISAYPTDYSWNIPRPVKIEKVSIQFPAGNSQPVELEIPQIPLEEWIGVPQKNTSSLWPLFVYDDCADPVRNLRFWPVPQVNANCILYVWEQLNKVTALTNTLYAPPGYSMAIKLSLAEILALHFERVLTPDFKAKASQARSAINNINQQIPKTRYDGIWGGAAAGSDMTWASRGRVRT
jgi:hypothetical protein